MATYGVKTAGQQRSLASLYSGNTSMQPLSSSGQSGFRAINQAPVSDVLNSAQVANQNRLSTINAATPKPSAPAAAALGGGAAAAASSPANTSPAGPAPAGFNETADPILAQIKAAGQRGVQDAASAALAGAKNDLINYGSAQVPQSLRELYSSATPTSDALLGDLPQNAILGALNDQGTAQAASANPYSTLAKLMQAHNANTVGIDQASNANNTYYGSAHANQLGQEGQDYLGAQDTAAQNLQALLSGENQNVLGAIGTAHDSYLQQLPTAYDRWIQAGGTGATTPTPGDGSGGGGTTTDPNQAGSGYGGGGQTSATPYLAALLGARGRTNQFG